MCPPGLCCGTAPAFPTGLASSVRGCVSLRPRLPPLATWYSWSACVLLSTCSYLLLLPDCLVGLIGFIAPFAVIFVYFAPPGLIPKPKFKSPVPFYYFIMSYIIVKYIIRDQLYLSPAILFAVVWKGHLLCWHVVEECQLLLCQSEQPCGPAATVWGESKWG